MSASPHVIDVDLTNFQAEVAERSRTTPVLLDFWATWCGPCRTLTPVLEKLAAEMKGRFVLGKVDVDANPQIAEAFRIQSVPTVILFAQGQMVDGFLGAQPEARIREMLAPHLGPDPGGPLEKAAALEREGRAADAIALLRQHLRERPDDAPARVDLARLLVAEGRADEARKVFEKVAGADRETDQARAVQAQLGLAAARGDLDELAAAVRAAPGDVAARLRLGKALVAAGRSEEGLEELYQAASLDLHHDDDAPRKALIEVFQALGFDDPLSIEYQQRLSVLLCS